MFWTKKLDWNKISKGLFKIMAGHTEVFAIDSRSITCQGIAVMILRPVRDIITVSVSLDCNPLIVGLVLTELARHGKWRVDYSPFIQVDGGDMLHGNDAYTYYSTREVLINSMPGMVFLKEHLS